MLILILRAAGLQRRPYLRMVLAPDGVADGALVVGAVYLVLTVPGIVAGAGIFPLVRFALGGLFSWIALAGLVYLLGRHVLEGDGTFPSVMAASSLAYPPLLVSLALAPVLEPFPALAVASVWSLLCLWMAARVSLGLAPSRAALAVAGGYGAWLVLSSIFSF